MRHENNIKCPSTDRSALHLLNLEKCKIFVTFWLKSWIALLSSAHLSSITHPVPLRVFGKLMQLYSIHSEQMYWRHTDLHSPLRRQACLAAVENAWRKAQEVCALVGQTLGRPLLIKEEETKDWEGQADDHQLSSLPGSLTIQQKIKSATIHAASKVFITYEVKGKERKKKHL